MNFLIHAPKEFFIALLITAILWITAHLVLSLTFFGSVRSLVDSYAVRGVVKSAPPDTLFICRKGVIYKILYDQSRDEESIAALEHAKSMFLLSWRRGSRSAANMKRRVAIEIILRSAIFLFATVPLIIFGIWLMLFVYWIWIYVVIFLLAHQALFFYARKFFFVRPRRCFVITLILFFHRTGWWHWSITTAVTICAIFILIPMVALIGSERRRTEAYI